MQVGLGRAEIIRRLVAWVGRGSQLAGCKNNAFYWATVCEAVCPVVSDRCPICRSVLSVCNVGVLWRNGWMRQDETLHAGMASALATLCQMGTELPSPKRGTIPQFSAYIYCGQMVGWIKMPLGREVGLGPSNIVLDENPAPHTQKGSRGPQFSAYFYCGQTAACIEMPLDMDVGFGPWTLC